MAVLAVQAGCGSPAKRRLPFTAMYFPDLGRQAPPYCAYIHLDGKGGASQEDQERGPARPTKAASRYRVPKKGQLQLVLSNPEGTPVHTFLASYDLEHLRPRSKTFLRQKTTAFPKQAKQMTIEDDGFLETQRMLKCTEVGKKVKSGSLRYAMQVRFACLPVKRSSKVDAGNGLEDADESRLYIYDCIRVIFAHQQADNDSEFLQTETCPCGDGLLSETEN
ncbi:hypothetical protein CYMTET_13489 [Cymbomonas tetramitiformis]|uniref:Atos-like C-terminal domain-containing protein n=1 Tax=Cymbomonas tetramitiformis TaxID=36881 RepID=A0AAE0LBB9_9CHLO|nr:hypothetical protein CYMTET_13489 [Cymbomonas tetramitiformis]